MNRSSALLCADIEQSAYVELDIILQWIVRFCHAELPVISTAHIDFAVECSLVASSFFVYS